jgi:uncharacterized damage-inducible protein DinB
MSGGNPVATLLADMVHNTSHGNRWHRLTTATEDLEKEDLSYKPVPAIGCDRREEEFPAPILTPCRILLDTALAAAKCGDAMCERTDDESEGEWDDADLDSAVHDPRELVAAVDTACRRLHARAQRLTDAELAEPGAGAWHSAAKAFVLVEGGILQMAWHFGQVAMLTNWRRAQGRTEIAKPAVGRAGRRGNVVSAREHDSSDFRAESPRELCLRLQAAAYDESPWHSICPMIEGSTAEETAWVPFPGESPRAIVDLCRHVAHCKVMYADHGFAEGTLRWSDCDRILGWSESRCDAEYLLAILGRAQEFLTEHVAAATDEDLYRVNPMHHKVPLTGWQVVASMAQHDAWHGGQIAIMRTAYRALLEG